MSFILGRDRCEKSESGNRILSHSTPLNRDSQVKGSKLAKRVLWPGQPILEVISLADGFEVVLTLAPLSTINVDFFLQYTPLPDYVT